jgi:uncharacterized protein
MGERTSHPPGSFSWTDLGTSDPEGAKRFYSRLFGWEPEDMPMPGGGAYTMLRLDGSDAAALYGAEEGRPTAWLSYVTVEDVDATVSRARELGAAVMQEPLDVLDAGRMAVLQDPTGAVLALWQPGTGIGATVVNRPGALSLNQLNTEDPERAQDFYGALFGWRVEAVGDDPVPYWGIFNGERLNGGMMQLPPDAAAPSHWLVYFGADDLDAAAARIQESGGAVLVPKTDVPGGQFLVAQDPQGAVFALFVGRFDD